MYSKERKDRNARLTVYGLFVLTMVLFAIFSAVALAYVRNIEAQLQEMSEQPTIQFDIHDVKFTEELYDTHNTQETVDGQELQGSVR